jgi:chemotaxis protein histidine kinase CheA
VSSADEPDPVLATALRALRREYLDAGRTRVAELWTAVTAVQNGDAEALARLQQLAHRLAGSGGGYGFPDITSTARATEQFCRELISRPSALDQAALTQLHALVDAVGGAFASAEVPE